MALADIALRELYNRLLRRFEASLRSVTSAVSGGGAASAETFDDRATFFASSGEFQFAWLNNAVGSDGIVSFWSQADDSAATANMSDVATIGAHKFIQLYVRESA